MEYETILQNISETALEISDDNLKIKIGSFEKTKKDLNKTLENELKYEEIFEQWFPHEKISPEKLKEAPKRILREFVLISVADYAAELSTLSDSERQEASGSGIRKYFRKRLMQFNIDSLDLKEVLETAKVNAGFIEMFLKWLYL